MVFTKHEWFPSGGPRGRSPPEQKKARFVRCPGVGPKDIPSELRQDARAARLHSSPSRFMSGHPSRCNKIKFHPVVMRLWSWDPKFRELQTDTSICSNIPRGFATAWPFLHCKNVQPWVLSRSYASCMAKRKDSITEQIPDPFDLASRSRVGGVFSNMQDKSAEEHAKRVLAAEVGVQKHARRRLLRFPSHQAAAASLRRQGQGWGLGLGGEREPAIHHREFLPVGAVLKPLSSSSLSKG